MNNHMNNCCVNYILIMKNKNEKIATCIQIRHHHHFNLN